MKFIVERFLERDECLALVTYDDTGFVVPCRKVGTVYTIEQYEKCINYLDAISIVIEWKSTTANLFEQLKACIDEASDAQ